MTRTAPGGSASQRDDIAYLLEVIFHDGSSEVPVRLTTAGDDLRVDANGDGLEETYTSVEGFLSWSGVTESPDQRSQGTRLELSGVDTTVISTLLQNNFRGRRVSIWRAQLNRETGDIDDTTLLHRGYQLAEYVINETPPGEDGEPGHATIRTRSISRIQALQATNAVKTNKRSHNAMLHRAGLSTGDEGFAYTPQLRGRVFWGTEAPDPAVDGTNDGASAGTGGGGSGSGGGGGDGRGGGGPTHR